ncbi:hypothetical protein M9Y10_022086 [Tritrichomonas musculus]|uniref:Protein kinase domain-containing protein n=1 Tax=Tritrichomonas musculus TaxID=1915356 RepID=A0ABR2KRF6_9EUKA
MISAEIEKFKVDGNDFEPIRSKGSIKGGCCVVVFVKSIKNQKEYVLKRTLRKLKKGDFQEKLYYNEIMTLSKFHHPAIVPFIGFCIDPKGYGNTYLEYMENGSLDSFINSDLAKGPSFDDTRKLIISYGIARAMKYLHSHKIIHRDLSIRNILLDAELHPYVSGFSTSTGIDTIKSSQTVQQTTATIMPPEFITDYDKYNRTTPIDVYSYAMLLYYLWIGQPPYNENETISLIINKVLANVRPQFPPTPSLSEHWKNLIRSCWDEKPSKRPTFSDICKMLESEDFITSNIDKALFNSYKEMIDSASGASQ